jgi:hypothetical protein
LNALPHTHGRSGLGSFNAGRYSHPQLDTLIDNMRVEPDLARRRAGVSTVLRLVVEELPYISLYRHTPTWAMVKKMSVMQWLNNAQVFRHRGFGTRRKRWIRVEGKAQSTAIPEGIASICNAAIGSKTRFHVPKHLCRSTR